MSVAARTEGRGESVLDADLQLEGFRERMLRVLVVVTLCLILPITVALSPMSLRHGNHVYFWFSWAVILDVVLIAILRRWLPLPVRAWMFALPGLVHVTLQLPAVVDPVGLASAVACCVYITALVGVRSAAIYGGLLVAILGAAAVAGPGDPATTAVRASALRPGVVAVGAIPLIGMMIAAVHVALRGLLRGFADAVASLRAAQQSDRRFHGVFEVTPDPLALVRLTDGALVEVNPAFERVLGWPRAEVLGRSIDEVQVLRPGDAEVVLRRLIAGQMLDGLELVAHRREGQGLQVVLDGRPAEVGGERVAVLMLRDVTVLRRLESSLRHAQRVEATGQLAGGIAHNFRNALGAILPNLDVCLEMATEEMRPALLDARTAASAAVDLATRLTRIARKESSNERVPVAMGALLGDLAALCRSTFGARCAIDLEIAGDGTVRADRGELHQVFLNLLLNARDAVAEAPQPHIAIRVRRSDDGRTLIASVTDDGAGMDEATLVRLGEPFFTTKASAGTGLGLSTAFASVREAGGRITVSSKRGMGSTFTVELPISEDARPGEAAHVAARLGGRALVVDDDRLMLEALGRQLAQLGIDAELVSEGQRAAERLRTAPAAYSLLLTDLEMPGVDGQELIALAKTLAPSLPVIVVTGSPTPGPVTGARAVLSKPVSTVELAATAARCLGVDAAGADGRSRPAGPIPGTGVRSAPAGFTDR